VPNIVLLPLAPCCPLVVPGAVVAGPPAPPEPTITDITELEPTG
jgi:hypothetical protein